MSRDVGLHHPVSDFAMPPIRPDEARDAEIALCPAHTSGRDHLNVDGRAYFCPMGGQFWRASRRQNGFHTQLVWPRGM